MPKLKPNRFRYDYDFSLMYPHRMEMNMAHNYDKMVTSAKDKIDAMSKEEFCEMYDKLDKTGPKVDEFLAWQTYKKDNNNG